MNNKIFYPLLAVLLILPFALIGWYWNLLPETIAVHYNINMEADRWGPKAAIFILPCVMLVLVPVLLAVPKLDPKRNIEKYMPVYRSIILATLLLMTLITTLEVLRQSGHQVPVDYPLYGMVLFIAFMGNLLLKLKPSYFIGIRTPWTLENEEVWRRTHRVGGYIWVFASLAMLMVMLITPLDVYTAVFMGYVAVIAIIPIAYSLWIYLKLKKQNT